MLPSRHLRSWSVGHTKGQLPSRQVIEILSGGVSAPRWEDPFGTFTIN